MEKLKVIEHDMGNYVRMWGVDYPVTPDMKTIIIANRVYKLVHPKKAKAKKATKATKVKKA